MEIIILCGIYLAELTCYYFGLRILFEIQQKSKAWMAAGILFPVIIGSLPIEDAAWKNVLVTVSVVLVMYLSIDGGVIEKGVRIIFFHLLSECINGAYTRSYNNILLIVSSNYKGNVNYLISKWLTAASVLLLYLVKDKVRKYKKAHINSLIYIVIGMIAFSMMLCLGIFNQVIIYLSNGKYLILYYVLNIAILVSILLLVVFVIYIKNTHEKMEQLLKTEQLLKESQVNYYKQILKKETDTRKYRHDMTNHLVYLEELLSKKKIEESNRYLESILGGFRKIQNTYYVTGNEMVDTIMNYFFAMLSENVTIKIIGRCPIRFGMEDTDVCTIFSNIFQNAVEEITENKLENAKIIIKMQKGKSYAEYIIKNSMSAQINKENIDKNGLPKSHKSDKRNHGIGMLNLKHTVEKNCGSFQWYQEENYFCVNIILPIQ